MAVRTFVTQRRNLATISDRFKQFVGKFAWRTTLGDSYAILNSCRVQANQEIWLSKGLVSNDFRSLHSLLIMHVWMVHKRLIVDGRTGKLVQESLFDLLWEETTNRIYGLGISEMMLNKRLEEVQGYSFKMCLELDNALMQTAEEEVLDEIGGALWRSVYNRRSDVEVDHVLELARYVREEQLALQDHPSEELYRGHINWGSVPVWGHRRTGDSLISESLSSSSPEKLTETTTEASIQARGDSSGSTSG